MRWAIEVGVKELKGVVELHIDGHAESFYNCLMAQSQLSFVDRCEQVVEDVALSLDLNYVLVAFLEFSVEHSAEVATGRCKDVFVSLEGSVGHLDGDVTKTACR